MGAQHRMETTMHDELISRAELLGDINSFTAEQRKAGEIFVELGLVLPREWLREDRQDGCGIDASAAGRFASGIYNVLVESGPRSDPRSKDDTRRMASSFTDLIKSGGDALLWALIRIRLEETEDEDLAELCESRGFMVRRPRRARPV